MTDQQIRVLFSRKVLEFEDAAAEMCIRRILFSEGNNINWQRAYEVALEEMPELKNYKAE